jgi:hypothetical protein
MTNPQPLLVITSIKNTCGACPAQWEGRTQDGEYVYIRYRWGYLSIRAGETENISDMRTVFGVVLDESGWDGVLSYGDLKSKVPFIVWPNGYSE